MFLLLKIEPHLFAKCEGITHENLCVTVADKEKSWFENQVKVDAAFLQELNVLDYSLLLAHQPLHRDELEVKSSFANLVVRTTK